MNATIMKQKPKLFFIAFIMSCGLVTSPQPHGFDQSSYERLTYPIFKYFFHLFYELANSLTVDTIVITMLLILIYIWINFLTKKDIKLNWIQVLLSVILAIFAVSGLAFYQPNIQNGTWDILFQDNVQLVKTGLMLTAWTLFYNYVQLTLSHLLTNYSLPVITLKQNQLSQLSISMKKKIFLSSFLIYFILLIPTLLINYPGTVSYDTLVQLIQFNRDVTLQNNHPIFSTALFGNAVKIGTKLGYPSLGVFLHALYHAIGSGLLVAFTSWVLYRLTKKAKLSFGYATFSALVPILANLIVVPVKDTMFSHAFAACIASLALYLYQKDTYYERKIYLVTIVTLTLAILLRKNATYALLPALAILVLFEIIQLLKKKQAHLLLVGILIIPLLLSSGIEKGLIHYYHVEDGVLEREKLSIPLQQTARYVIKYQDDIPKEQAEIIDKVIDYQGIPKNYIPTRSDPVKESFRENVSMEDMKAYLGVWAEQLKTHPVVYFEATMHQIFPLFTLINGNNYYSSLESVSKKTEWTNSHFEIYNLKQPDVNKDLSLTQMAFFKWIDGLPLFGLLNNYSLYIIMILMILALALYHKFYKVLWLILPTLLLLGTLVVGPLMLSYHRYFIPFVLMTPLYLTLITIELKQKKNEIDPY